MTEDAMIRLFEDHPNRMVMTVNAATGQVELAEDITLAEAKYCIDVLANHLMNLSDQIVSFNKQFLEGR